MGEVARFKHEPLPDSTTHIRLLEIESVGAEDRVVCHLTAWPVEDAPNYYALSYTWGAGYQPHHILINGCVFPAGGNCIYALRQAHSSKASRYFWMDALCIDQSTTEEKSHQVGMMGQIYARSVHVLACVGPHTDDSISFFQTIHDNRGLLASIHGLTLGSKVENTKNWVVPNPIPKSSWVALRCLLAISPHNRLALATAFIDFMKRPYFSRVWVMQELHLAPEISLCCGMDIRSFDYLLAVSMLVDFWTNASDYRDSLTGIVTFVTNIASWQSWYSRREESCLPLQDDLHDVLPQRGCLTLASGFRGRRRLAEVLEAMQSFQCTDARDRLFGVLALVEWGDGEPTIPDYKMNNYEVAVEVLRLYLNNPETQPLLGMAVQWPRPLWELFNVRGEREAVFEAITERYGSHKIPGTVHTTFELTNPLRIGRVEAYFSRREISLQNMPTRPPHIGGHLRDTWYGVKLIDIADREATNSRNRPPYYLCCKKSHLESSPDSIHRLVEITDQDGCLFAYAPEDTRPNDWLMISQAGSLSDVDPEMAVVRSTNNVRGIYHMIGHVFKDRRYEKKILSMLHWDYFESTWEAEDLFLFDWTYMGRPVGAHPRLTSDWLSKVVPTRENSSFFYGPITHIRDAFAMLKPGLDRITSNETYRKYNGLDRIRHHDPTRHLLAEEVGAPHTLAITEWRTRRFTEDCD